MDSDLTIHTVDNIEHRIPRLIFNMLGNLQSQLEQIGPILKLNSVKSEEFSLIIEYCNHHNYVNPPPISRPLKFNELKKCVVDEWDSDFINAIDIDGITDLLISCERLNCSSLLDLCYAKLALFYRESDFSDNDLKEVKVGNKWLMSLTEDRIKELDGSNN